MTTFKPFNIREIDFDVWDDALNAKQDHIQREYHHLGLAHAQSNDRGMSPRLGGHSSQGGLSLVHAPSTTVALRQNEIMPQHQFE